MKDTYIQTLFKITTTTMLLALFLNNCNSPQQPPQEQEAASVQGISAAAPEPSATPIHSDSLGWGYEIFVDGKLYIHQPHVPAIQGRQGFATEADAMKAASLVMDKIRHKIIPPALSIEEMDSLGILPE
ncbi:MAG: DUF4907 domain-containing protein [Flavobacteriales bacterium]